MCFEMPLLFHNQRKSHNNLEGDQHLLKPDCDPAEQPLLLPEEYCLVEDEHATFDLHAERKGFHFLNGSVWLFKVRVKIYLTNYRVAPLSTKNLILGNIHSIREG